MFTIVKHREGITLKADNQNTIDMFGGYYPEIYLNEFVIYKLFPHYYKEVIWLCDECILPVDDKKSVDKKLTERLNELLNEEIMLAKLINNPTDINIHALNYKT